MIRSTASKVMWVGRATVFLVGLSVILAVVLGVATSAMGANGKPFLLGKRNVASAISTLVKKGPGPALNLQVGAEQPPLAVNSAVKVANLNADRVDGEEASSFADGVGGVATNADKLAGQEPNQLAPILRAQQDTDFGGSRVSGTTEINSVSIDAPVNGVLIISGTALVNNDESAATVYNLNPKVDGTNATPAGRAASFAAAPNATAGFQAAEIFTLSYTLSDPVSSGSHTVTQELGRAGGNAANFFYADNELSVQFVPGTRASVQ